MNDRVLLDEEEEEEVEFESELIEVVGGRAKEEDLQWDFYKSK